MRISDWSSDVCSSDLPDIAAATAPGGHAILAGLIARQMEPVFAAYRAQGFRLAARGGSAEWPCLLLTKRRRYGYRRKERAFHRPHPAPANLGSWEAPAANPLPPPVRTHFPT